MRNIEVGSDGKCFTVTVSGSETFFIPMIPIVDQETKSTAGALSVTNYHSKLDTTSGALAFTLADGTMKGQLKKVTMVVDSGDGTLTIATPESASEDVITFADVGDTLELLWSGTAWEILATYNVASGDTGPSIA